MLSPTGRLIRSWRVPARPGVAQPHPVAAVAGSDGFVYVGDEITGRILKFTPEGESVGEWNDSADAGRAWGLAASGSHLYVLRGGSPRLEVWTFDGRLELTDDLGNRLSQRPDAGGLAVIPGPQDDDLLVMDAVASRVLHFRLRLGQNP